MADIRTFRADSLSQLLARIKDISDLWAPGPSDPEELWFRGDQQTYPLLPSLYRNYSASWAYDEENLNERFRVRASPEDSVAKITSLRRRPDRIGNQGICRTTTAAEDLVQKGTKSNG